MRLTRISTIVLLLLVSTGLLPLKVRFLASLAPTQAQTTQDRKSEADRLYQQGIQQYQTSQFEAALQSLQQALQIYRELNDRPGEGYALGNLGNAYNVLGNYDKAIEYHEQSLAIVREIKDRQAEGQALLNLGNAYYGLGNYDKAIEYHEQSLAIAQEIQDQHLEGQALSNLGSAYDALGNYDKAIEYHEQSLAIAREAQDRPVEGAALGNLGNVYYALGNYDKAIEYHEQQLAIAQDIKNRQVEGQALASLGLAYDALGNYGKAIEYYEQSLAIARAIQDRHVEGVSLSYLGLAYLALGNYGKAIEYHEQSLAIARDIQDRQAEGAALGNLGNVYHALGNYGKAIEDHKQSLAIARDIKDRSGEGQSLGNVGNAYLALGNYGKAIEYQEQRLAIAREIKDRQGEGQSLGNVGLAYYALGNYGKAIEYQEQSLAIARDIKDRQGEGFALNDLGLAFFKSGNLPEAAKTLMNGIATWEAIRRTGVGNNDANKVSIFDQQANTYRTLQQVLVAQHQLNAALEIAERGRARALIDLLAQKISSAQLGDIRQHTSDTRSQQAAASATLEQIQQIAKIQNVTLVEYSIVYDEFEGQQGLEDRDSTLYIWVIQPNGQITFRSVDLKPLWQQHTSLAKLVAAARCFGSPSCEQTVVTRSIHRVGGVEVVYSPNASDRLSNSIIHSQSNAYLHQLHQLLIEPIADLLPTDPTAHVVFMPQESLFLVPFAALVDKSNHYLVQQHTISIAPSIQVLGFTHQQQAALPKNTTPSVLVAGDPTMPKVVIPGEDAPLTLPDLPGAKQEAIAVAKTLNTTALVGNQATKRAIMQQMQTARMIHLATHGLLDDFKGLGIPGAIALAPDGTGQPNDGLLTADDILSMKLKAELVVLSACDTGQGRLTGDGVIGLSRSLISAGVPSVVVSLWSIPDAPTASLMTQFYQNLQHTPDKAQALRQAMLSTMKDHPASIDWAAFTLIGEAQ